ncbi:MAG: AAA family ATPase [Deltaproteobacteria bacterium]|nr:AAA family ATPase [Deltaproteobacteria bacterium]
MDNTDPVVAILTLAAQETIQSGYAEITPAHLLIALSKVADEEGGEKVPVPVCTAIRNEFASLGLESRRFRRRLRKLLGNAGGRYAGGTVHRSPACRVVFAAAQRIAQEEQEPFDARHLVRAAFAVLAERGTGVVEEASPTAMVSPADNTPTRQSSLGELTRRLRGLRTELLQCVYGQSHAVQQFIDGLFNIEVVATADTERRRPAGLFVFAGPPGVWKTFLAELGATFLNRPFKRFDMSAYAHTHEAAGLIGIPRFYKDAQPGILTDFVQHNPNAVLLFDEIEKAHLTIIQLFLQILDAGRLQDKYTEQDVAFRDTMVIFTTNVGRTLFDNENVSGVHQVNASFHRTTILDALRSEVDPRTREPFFPAALCSRLATGYPILFNHLGVDDLTQIAQAELARVGTLLERQHGQRYAIAAEVPLALVMREGAQADARTIKAQAEAFLKEEVFKACQLFADERVDTVLAGIAQVSVEIDDEHAGEVADRLFRETVHPVVLFVGDPLLGQIYTEGMPEVDWCVAPSADQVFDTLTKRAVDFVLLDLGLQPQAIVQYEDLAAAFRDVSVPLGPDKTILAFDHSPPAARQFAAGQHILHQLHTRMPDTPVFLFSVEDGDPSGFLSRGVDEELLRACVRAGGARGVIRAALRGGEPADWERQRDALRARLEEVAQYLRRERMAAELARQNQVVTFDTAPLLCEDGQRLRVRCRNFRLGRAVRSGDTNAVLSDVERPTTRFAEVIGAAGAKEALTFLRDWLREPKKYAAAGVDPPRGVLLTGSPGTGKTMLARALAGESDCAFLVESATSFVTLWQGSGPQNIRDLFTRARRYAPSIVFIDEIDAIGKMRTGAAGAGRAEEETLNALLTEMDGFSKEAARPVIVIAATNHAELLDAALLRRFSRVIEAELPTRAERELYLRTRLDAKAKHEVSPQMIERLAVQSAGLSIANLENILAQASILALANAGIITDPILGEAFEKVTLGEAKPGADPLRTARHEAGHALVMSTLGQPPIYVTIVGRGAFGGYAAPEVREEKRSHTRRELEDLLCQLLGGREAERLYYDNGDGDSTGPSNDLERATQIAETMVYELGMAEEVGFVRIDRQRPLPSTLADRCHAAVRSILDAQCIRARQLLTERRPILDQIVEALLERNRLLKEELLAVIERAGGAGAA